MPQPKAKYEVLYFPEASADPPVKTFLRGLDPKARAKCYVYIDQLRERGLTLPASHLEKVEDGLWALRPEWANVEYRLFFTTVGTKFVMVHAIKKKSGKLKPRDVQTARSRAKEVQEYYASTNRPNSR